MKKLLLCLTVLTIVVSCSGAKQIEKEVGSGNYDQAINNAVRRLKTNKDSKRKADFINLLKDAFAKAVSRDLNRIAYLKNDGNAAHYEEIYTVYRKLNRRQERIKPVMPLYLDGAQVNLGFSNYNNDITAYKEKTSHYIYNNAKGLLTSENKLDARLAFQEFQYLEKINPNYSDVRHLMETAHKKGTDYVLVRMKNDTRQSIPRRLENDLLNFGTYGLDNLWMVYHNTKDRQVKYDFALDVNLREIIISPEQVKEREIIREKEVVDGWQYVLDPEGNVVKDSLGNDIKVDKLIQVSCSYYESKQLKQAKVIGNVEYRDLKNRQLIEAFPIQSEFIFEHIYATTHGDRRALDESLTSYLSNKFVPFPSNEQMIYDTGEDLKLQLKEIITGNNFRR